MDKLVLGMVIGLAAIATLFTLMATQVGIGGGFVDYALENPAIVMIPINASDQESGQAFVPQTIIVIIGVNNTVRWINQDTSMHWIEADNDRYDSAFYQLTEMTASAQADRSNIDSSKDKVLYPNEYFEYTFTKPGEYGYHSKPWMRGTVIVMESR
jgi:plastocyanin